MPWMVLVILALIGPSLAGAAEFVVRGIDDPSPERLAAALAHDDALLMLSTSLTPRRTFLDAVKEKATLALERLGYAEAAVKAHLDDTPSPSGDRVIVEVVPGQRWSAGGIEITGAPDELADAVRSWLKSQRPPPGAIAVEVDTGDGWGGMRWIDAHGQPAVMKPALWSRGQPAPFDEPWRRDARAAIARCLRDHGHHAAAHGVEKPSSRGPDCTLEVVPGDDGATFTIAFHDLPPASLLRDIEVAPAGRVSAGVLRESLGITLHAPATECDRLAWQETLRRSGRFVRHDVKFKESKPDATGATEIVAIFDLIAYPHVPPYGTELAREAATMLRCREWLLTTLANDDDLAIAVNADAAPEEPHAIPACDLVISTSEGLLVSASNASVALGGTGFGCYLPSGCGAFEVPLAPSLRIWLGLNLGLEESVNAGKHAYGRTLHMSAGAESRSRDDSAAVVIRATIEPVAVLALLDADGVRTRWDDNTLVVETAAATATIDSATGRLLTLHLATGDRLTVTAAPRLLAARLAACREAAGVNTYKPDAPVTSAVAFFAGDEFGSSAAAVASLVAPSLDLAAWRSHFDPIASKLRDAAARDAFSGLDRRVVGLLNELDDGESRRVVIPQPSPGGDVGGLASLAGKAAGWGWRWLDHCCGGDAWPTTLVRIATRATRHDMTGALWDATAFLSATRHGPIANLAAATLIPVPSMAASFAKQGQTRLTTEAFHADCSALLTICRDCGLDRCAVSLIRTLSDDESRDLAAQCLQSPEAVMPLVNDLRRCATDDEALAALPDALDHWWESSLRPIVAAALSSKADIHTAETPAAEPTPRR